MDKKELDELKKEIIKDLMKKIDSEFKDIKDSQLTESDVRKIIVKSLGNLFKVLWSRKGTWADQV